MILLFIWQTIQTLLIIFSALVCLSTIDSLNYLPQVRPTSKSHVSGNGVATDRASEEDKEFESQLIEQEWWDGLVFLGSKLGGLRVAWQKIHTPKLRTFLKFEYIE